MNTTTMKNGATSAPAATPERYMSLSRVRKGKLDMPLRVLVYGPEGCGKSTFASRAPKPIFLGADAGTENLSIERLPEPRSWEDAIDGIRLLQSEEHDRETLVIDPINWLEPLCWTKVCKDRNWRDIEDPGYGKGYGAAFDEWRVFVAELERLWTTKRMHIVALAHVQTKVFKNPEGEDYERFSIPMHEKAAGLLRQWFSFVLLARYEAFAKKDEKTKRVRGISSGARILHTQWSAAFDAKNRADLPEELPLSWESFYAAVKSSREREAALREQITAGVKQIGDASVAKKVSALLAEAGDDVARIAEIANAVAVKLEEVGAGAPMTDASAAK